MEKFKTTLKRRMAWFAALFLLSLVLPALSAAGVLPRAAAGAGPASQGFLDGFRFGGFAFCAGASLLLVVRWQRALASAERLEALYIRETDERAVLIRQNTGGFAYMLFNFLLLLAVVAASYLNVTAALSILGVTTAYTLLRAGLKLYYARKYTA